MVGASGVSTAKFDHSKIEMEEEVKLNIDKKVKHHIEIQDAQINEEVDEVDVQ